MYICMYNINMIYIYIYVWERERDSQKKCEASSTPPTPPPHRHPPHAVLLTTWQPWVTPPGRGRCRGSSRRGRAVPQAAPGIGGRFPTWKPWPQLGIRWFCCGSEGNLWNCCEVGMLVVFLLFSRAFSVFHAGQRSYFIRLEWTNSRSCAAGWLKRAFGSTSPSMGSNLKRLPAMAQCTAWDRCQKIGMSQRIRFMSATSAQAASFASHHFLVQHEAMQHWPGTRGKRFRMVAENSLVLGSLVTHLSALLSLKVRQIIALIPSRNREF